MSQRSADKIELNNNCKNNNGVRRGGPGTGTRRKHRKNITLAMKMEIINRLEQGQTNSSICHEYNLPSSTVSTIRSKKEQIKQFCRNSSIQSQFYQISYSRNNIIEEVEVKLYKWIKDSKFDLETVRYSEVRKKALKIFDDAKRKRGITDEKIDFKASHGWFDRFRKRFMKHQGGPILYKNFNTIIPIMNGTTTLDPIVVNQPMMVDTNEWSMMETNHSSNNSDNSVDGFIEEDVVDEDDDDGIGFDGDNFGPSGDGITIEEPITMIEEDNNDKVMTKNNFENDIVEMFWGKIVSSIFSNEALTNNYGRKNLDAKTLALVFKLNETIIHILESRDPDRKRFQGFKQNLAHILHPYREIYNRQLSNIKDSLKSTVFGAESTSSSTNNNNNNNNDHRVDHPATTTTCSPVTTNSIPVAITRTILAPVTTTTTGAKTILTPTRILAGHLSTGTSSGTTLMAAKPTTTTNVVDKDDHCDDAISTTNTTTTTTNNTAVAATKIQTRSAAAAVAAAAIAAKVEDEPQQQQQAQLHHKSGKINKKESQLKRHQENGGGEPDDEPEIIIIEPKI